jgi:hypothetical protein
MAFAMRSPSGRVYCFDDADDVASIKCTSVSEALGQWIVYSRNTPGSLVAGLRNGVALDRVSDSLVFTSALDEAGEEFIAILESHRLRVVRISLDTPKLSLATYYELLERFVELFSIPPVGAMSVAGSEAIAGRVCDDTERAFSLVRLAFTFVLACHEVRKDIGRHARGSVGQAGVDALATLAEWRTNSSWYCQSHSGEIGSIACGERHFVLPLRSVPRVSVGGNLFLGGLIHHITTTASGLPRNSGGMMTSSLLQIARRILSHADVIAHVDGKQARTIVHDFRRLPKRSETVARLLLEIDRISRSSWNSRFSSGGMFPFILPETERVFQQVAVSSILLALGMAPEQCETAISTARSSSGVEIGEKYRAWYDTPSHALVGWRTSTQSPSNYRPDLVVQRLSDGAWLLIDAKLRQGQGGESLFSQSAIKEMQAYMQEYGLPRSVLLVPSLTPHEWTYADVKGGGCHIRAIGVPASKKLFEESYEARNKLEEMWNS